MFINSFKKVNKEEKNFLSVKNKDYVSYLFKVLIWLIGLVVYRKEESEGAVLDQLELQGLFMLLKFSQVSFKIRR